MSVISVSVPGRVGISELEIPVVAPVPGEPPAELDGRKLFTPKSDAAGNVAAQSREMPETKSGRVRS